MTTDSFFSYLTQLLYIVVFVVAVKEVIRRPRQANLDIALLFGATSCIIAASWAFTVFNVTPSAFANAITNSLLMALPYLLIRLVNDFAGVPTWITRTAEGGLVLAVLGLFLLPTLPTTWLALVYVAYFLALEIYAAVVFVHQASHSPGVTRRRLHAAALGSIFLGLIILIAGLQLPFPGLNPLWNPLTRLLGLFSGLAYLLGFAPPGWVRRAWQVPELRGFLGTASRLPRLATTQAILRQFEAGATQSLGATGAVISLWDETTQHLQMVVEPTSTGDADQPAAQRFEFNPESGAFAIAPNQLVSGRIFVSQQPTFVEDIGKVDPQNADLYRATNANSLVGAPITAGDNRLGVLLVFGARPALFAEDDLELLQLLADQAALILESRALIDEAARVRAREETARLKEDFFSAAAHDLRTPLTAILSQTQLIRRRVAVNPDAPNDPRGLQRIEDETHRLIRFVSELLDVSRVEEGRILGERERVDLAELVRAVAARPRSNLHPVVVDAEQPVICLCDWNRIEQVVENLLENAVKYSPEGGTILIKVWSVGPEAHLTVRDQGIGIPAGELPRIFDRFHRGSNVNDRQFAGLGLGLFICRSIVEAHGGHMTAESTLGRGTTIHVVLPRYVEEEAGD